MRLSEGSKVRRKETFARARAAADAERGQLDAAAQGEAAVAGPESGEREEPHAEGTRPEAGGSEQEVEMEEDGGTEWVLEPQDEEYEDEAFYDGWPSTGDG